MENKVCVDDENGVTEFKETNNDKKIVHDDSKGELKVKNLGPGLNDDNMVAKVDFNRKCMTCKEDIRDEDDNLSWETMEFCNKSCLSKYQKKIGSKCANCKAKVPSNCMGKYCGRFQHTIKIFCSQGCLEKYKKELKVCSYCQKDISQNLEDVLAPIETEDQFTNFCSQQCMEKYDVMGDNRDSATQSVTSQCSKCLEEKQITIEYEHDGKTNLFCGELCFVAFKFVNNITPGKCDMCHKYFDNKLLEQYAIYYDDEQHNFCSISCQTLYIICNRKIVPCNWCKFKKYNFDMIKSSLNIEELMFCSLNCLNLHMVSKQVTCDYCQANAQPLYHLTMADATIRNFCSLLCIMTYQNQSSEMTTSNESDESDESLVFVPTGAPEESKRLTENPSEISAPPSPTIPVIVHVESLAPNNETPSSPERSNETNNDVDAAASTSSTVAPIRERIIIKTASGPPQSNMGTMCKPRTSNRGISCASTAISRCIQTDEVRKKTVLVPIPVPIHVPTPMFMYSYPFPVPFPIPLPVPVPIFIPTACNSANDIMKEIKRIQGKTPMDDPMDVELPTLPKMVAEDTEDDYDDTISVIQIPIKNETVEDSQPIHKMIEHQSVGQQPSDESNERGRDATNQIDVAMMTPPQPSVSAIQESDGNMCLIYTFGVNAWKQWVTNKNSELERTSRPVKLLKTEILQMTADELNYSLCLFVDEIRKPNGEEYTPDMIYYLCLGIQQYLFENERTDNIFYDVHYENFIECFGKIAQKFTSLYDSHYIETRITEEQLWECKQLGVCSPHVLLTTLMFFNTKHFYLTSVDEHMQLSFAHINKLWNYNSNESGTTRSRNVVLAYYPPKNATVPIQDRKVYLQRQNKDNPFRCPVNLYEFYLSKCPESVKTRNNMYYLLPKRCCTPESPVWFSTIPLPKSVLEKSFHRIQMTKEINIAILFNRN